MAERRAARRYGLAFPVTIQVPGNGGMASYKGHTRDVSTAGVYCVIEDEIDTNTTVDLTMTFPIEVTNGTGVFVHASGRVVRGEKRKVGGDRRVGIAAVMGRYEFVRSDSAATQFPHEFGGRRL